MNLLLRDRVARLIWLVALLVRLAFAGEVVWNDLDLTHNDQFDMIFLHGNAEKIADGDLRLVEPYQGNYVHIRTDLYGAKRYDDLYGRYTYVDSPGYLYFAAACEALHRSPYSVIVVQLLLDALGCALVYVLARRTYGLATARVALVAAALCLECVAEAGFVLRESVIAFLVTASLLALDHARRQGSIRSWGFAGLVFGAGWITKLSFSLFAPAIPLLIWIHTTGPGRARASAQRLAAFALGASIAVLPFAARNVSLGVPPLRMSSTAMQVMVQRNMAGYAGAAEHIDPKGVKAILDRSDDTLLGAWRAAVDSHPPGGYLRQLENKAYYFWLGADFWNNIRCSYLEKLSPILALCVVRWGVLGPWTAIALVLAVALPSRRRATLHLVLAFVTLGIVAALVGGVYTRYRMIVEPIACIFFAATVVDVATCLRDFGKARFKTGLALLGVALVLHWRLQNPVPPLPKRELASYVLGTWGNRKQARDYLLRRVEASNAPD